MPEEVPLVQPTLETSISSREQEKPADDVVNNDDMDLVNDRVVNVDNQDASNDVPEVRF